MNTARLQPCKSPVWDTALTLRALADSGLDGTHPAVERGVHWLLAQEIRTRGDWARGVDAAARRLVLRIRQCVLSRLGRYGHGADWRCAMRTSRSRVQETSLPPDLRLIAEAKARTVPDARCQAMLLDDIVSATHRAAHWMLTMQNRDGGWGAFDRDNTAEFLCHVPFADHNAMIDPSSPDLAARVLESLAATGKRIGDTAVDRGIAYLRRTQETDGSWFGRWGVNYIYGTWQALMGLTAVGVPHDDPAVVGRRAMVNCPSAAIGWMG